MAPTTAEHEQMEELKLAIDTVTPEVLRVIVTNMCQENQWSRERVASSLLVTEDKVSKDASDDEEYPANEKEHSSTSKRLRPRYAYCENCEKEFDVTENTSTSCKFHTDLDNPDYELFVDHDEDCHGVIDCDEMRKEFPERFFYECCDRHAKEEPCTTDWHREQKSTKRRKFY